MRKPKVLMCVGLTVLAALFLSICRSAAGRAPNTQASDLGRLLPPSAVLAAPKLSFRPEHAGFFLPVRFLFTPDGVAGRSVRRAHWRNHCSTYAKIPAEKSGSIPAPSAISATREEPVAAPQAQTAVPSGVSSSPAPHRAKVWTNEDLIATRTPADKYIFQKEADTAAQQDGEFAEIASCFAFGQPAGNAEESQKAIDETTQSIRDSEEAIAQVRKALGNAPENLRLRNQLELSQRTAELNQARERLFALQDHLRELQKPSVPANRPANSQ
jgi:hypothetical protein